MKALRSQLRQYFDLFSIAILVNKEKKTKKESFLCQEIMKL